MPLMWQNCCHSKVQMLPKKVLKRFIKNIKKFGAICPSQIQKKKKPTTFCGGFYYLKTISDITFNALFQLLY
jgi:hypothetical protein